MATVANDGSARGASPDGEDSRTAAAKGPAATHRAATRATATRAAALTPDQIPIDRPRHIMPFVFAPQRTRTTVDVSLQFTISVVVVVCCWISVHPLGMTGRAGLITVLLVLNSLFLVARNIQGLVVPARVELFLLLGWAVAASGLLALQSLGFAPAFGYFVAGHAGYRLGARQALGVAAFVGILSALGLRLAQAQGVPGWPWLLGLTVALTVFIGMTNRSRDSAVASAVEAAVAAKKAAEAEARAQTLAERARISRDIHDVLAHSLSGVSMQLELSEMLLDDGNVARAREAIGRAHSMVREGMVEARRAVESSRAEVLPLDKTLRSLFSTAATVVISGDVRELPTAATQTLVRVAQESLTNARRHARGAGLEVELRYFADQVELEVSNGPVDIKTSPPDEGSGMGLVGMRERVALLEGQAKAGPILQGPMAGGWRVSVTLPV